MPWPSLLKKTCFKTSKSEEEEEEEEVVGAFLDMIFLTYTRYKE
jgi:hypothetical protein